MLEIASLRYFLIAVFFLIVLPIRVFAQSPDFKSIPSQDEIIRKSKSRNVIKYMNLRANPCQDFYEFACGNYAKYHTSSEEHLQNKINRDFSRILQIKPTLNKPVNKTIDKPVNKTVDIPVCGVVDKPVDNPVDKPIDNPVNTTIDDPVDKPIGNSVNTTIQTPDEYCKIKGFYKSCITAVAFGKEQRKFFEKIITHNGGFPAASATKCFNISYNYNWQQAVGQLRYRYGMNILVGLRFDINYENTDENSIYLEAPTTIIPRHICNADTIRQLENVRNPVFKEIKEKLIYNIHKYLVLDKRRAIKAATDLMAFEFELCSAIEIDKHSDTQGGHPNYTRMTLEQFTKYFNESLDFKAASFGMSIIKPVYMTSENYYRQLINTTQETNLTIIANYIMYRALDTLSFPSDDHSGNRQNFCLKVTELHFPKIMAEMYYKNYSSTATRNDTENIFDEIKLMLRKNRWQPRTKDDIHSVEESKLSKISLNFPSYEKMHLKNLTINQTNYWQNLEKVLAFGQSDRLRKINDSSPRFNDEIEAYDMRLRYRPTHKRIDIGWGLLQEPFYHQSYPNAIRYATIGHKLAQTLVSAFDDIGWSSDVRGLWNWDTQTAQAYQNLTECFRQQISYYLHNDPKIFHNTTMIRQLIATSSALNLAFDAYLNWLQFLNPNNDFTTLMRETLPELNFTNTQLFFIAFAQAHCKSEKKNEHALAYEYSPRVKHSLHRYEVNGPLMNYIEFARDFGCSVGVEMNQADKCVVY